MFRSFTAGAINEVREEEKHVFNSFTFTHLHPSAVRLLWPLTPSFLATGSVSVLCCSCSFVFLWKCEAQTDWISSRLQDGDHVSMWLRLCSCLDSNASSDHLTGNQSVLVLLSVHPWIMDQIQQKLQGVMRLSAPSRISADDPESLVSMWRWITETVCSCVSEKRSSVTESTENQLCLFVWASCIVMMMRKKFHPPSPFVSEQEFHLLHAPLKEVNVCRTFCLSQAFCLLIKWKSVFLLFNCESLQQEMNSLLPWRLCKVVKSCLDVF